jgi:transcriptional regulator with XRE-family HTH domain
MAIDEAIFNRVITTLDKIGKARLTMCADLDIPTQNITNLKTSMPAADTAIKIAEYLGVSVKWLITGIEEPDFTKEDQDLLDAFHRLNDEGKENAILLVRALETKYPLSEDGGLSKTAT